MTLWPRARHTSAKHAILKRYLDAWLPIMSRYNEHLVLIDGFAGPGEYAGGEPGSPVIALDCALTHTRDLNRTELTYIFIERDDASRAHLESLLRSRTIPSNVSTQVLPGLFDERATKILDRLESVTRRPPPAFVMVDPFGFSGVPFEIIRRLATHPKSEVLFTLMSESINRFISKPELEGTFDSLFGHPAWRQTHELSTPDMRWEYIYRLYASQLKSAGFQWVRAFEMKDDGGRTEYHLTFATHGMEGLKQMKAAMWSVDPSGQYRFSDATDPNQLTLFGTEPDWSQLQKEVLQHFRTRTVSVREIEEFVLCHTAFRETHVRRALVDLEKSGTLQPEYKPGRRRGTFPSALRVTFAAF